MANRQITSEIEEIVDREDWFGEDSHGNVIRFMMASGYAMSRFHQLYAQTPKVFTEGPCRYIATALFDVYEKTNRVIAVNPGRRTRIQSVIEHFSKIADHKERKLTTDLFMRWLSEVKSNLHYYTSKRDIKAAIEQSQTMFAHARAEILLEEIVLADNSIDVPVDFINAVEKAVENYQRKIDTSGNVVVFSRIESDMIYQAHAEVSKPVFTLPTKFGPISDIMNPQFIPGAFITFMGPEKRGKSWWLQELAIHSARQVPTLYIQAGDMSTEMVIRRMATRFLKRGYKERYCGELFIPTLDCVRNKQNACNKERRCNKEKYVGVDNGTPEQLFEANPDYVPCAECARCNDRAWKPEIWWTKRNPVEPYTVEDAVGIFQKMRQSWRGDLLIADYPSNTLTVSKVKALLNSYAMSGVHIGTIVLDYMDLLAAEKGNSRDYRHFQNELWKDFRGMLQEYELCGIVATQANITSQDCDYIDMGQISEDKRKASHVTAMWGLNQTKEEKQRGIMRVNQVVVRDDDFDTRQQIAVLQCLAIGQPILGSYIVPDYKE